MRLFLPIIVISYHILSNNIYLYMTFQFLFLIFFYMNFLHIIEILVITQLFYNRCLLNEHHTYIIILSIEKLYYIKSVLITYQKKFFFLLKQITIISYINVYEQHPFSRASQGRRQRRL